MINRIKEKNMSKFSHLDQFGNVKMVDVSEKVLSTRIAKAVGKISMQKNTITAIQNQTLSKGNVLTTAKLAGIYGAKKTAEMIPLCHQINLSFIDIEFEIMESSILIKSTVKTKEATGVEMEALSSISNTALTIYDMCKAIDKTMVISEVKLVEKIGGKSDHLVEYRPQVGVITLSDSISKGMGVDLSGPILINRFKNEGCTVDHQKVLPDGSVELIPLINKWINENVKLIITTGGTGLGPRDLTIETLDKIFDSKLPGVEQALHSYGRDKVKTAILSRLIVGVVKGTIIICLPGSSGAVKDALNVLIPTIFHSFHMMNGEKH